MATAQHDAGYIVDEENGSEEPQDPVWVLTQKKAFTAWCNSHLRRVGTQIEVIDEDFRDGLKLMLLLEVISNEVLPKAEKGKMRFHKIANVNKALNFIETKGVKLVSIGAEEIVDGNLKMTLGMIWTIILRFAIQEITMEDLSAKEGLLLWCQRKTAPYKNVNVQNFHTSFKDGLAFCALIHRHRPDLIDYSRLAKENPLENLNYAFEVAEKYLDIPPMLDAEDMVKNVKPDELSVMAYVSSYYHAFSGAQKAETAANRITRVLKVNLDNEKLMANYDSLSSSLLAWIEHKLPFFSDRESGNSLEVTQRKLQTFRDYQRGEKPPKLEEKAKLETTLHTLQTRLRLSNRPAYVPSSGKLVNDINRRWKELESSEKSFEEWLLAELRTLEHMEHLAQKFHLRCNTHEAWSKGLLESLSANDYKHASLPQLKALLKKHEAFESDLGAHQARLESIVRIAEELNQLGYHNIDPINSRCSSIANEWRDLGAASTARRKNLEHTLALWEQIDQLFLQFAKNAAKFKQWLEQSVEDMQDVILVRSVEEVEALIHTQDQFKATLNHAANELNGIVELSAQAEEIATSNGLDVDTINPYTALTPDLLTDHWNQLTEVIPVRDNKLADEINRQRNHEKLRRQFAEKANFVGPWLERQQGEVNEIISSAKGTLEDERQQLQIMETETLKFQPNLDELDRCNHSLQEALVFDNVHTPFTMETLRVGWEQLLTSIRRSANEVDNQILTRDSKGITEEQMDEFRKSFNHFDKNKSRRLEPKEFKACLVSLGYNIRDDKQEDPHMRRASVSAVGDADFQRVMSMVDPNNTNYVTFDAFLDFMTRETADRDTSEQMLESFKILASDRPFITADTLRRELGEEEAEYCIEHMESYPGVNGGLNYASFTASLYGESDL